MSKLNNGRVPTTHNTKKKKSMNIMEHHHELEKKSQKIKPFSVHPTSATGVRNRFKL